MFLSSLPVPISLFLSASASLLHCTSTWYLYDALPISPPLPPSLLPCVPFSLYAADRRCALVPPPPPPPPTTLNGHPFRPIWGDVSVQLRELVERDPRLRKGFYAYYRENYAKGKAGKIMGASSKSDTAASSATGATGATHGGGGGRSSSSDTEANGRGRTFPEKSAGVARAAQESEGPFPVPSCGSAEMPPPVGGRRDAAREPMEEKRGDGDEESASPSPSPSAMREVCLSSSCPAASRRGKVKAGAGKAVVVSKGGHGRGRNGRGGGGMGGGREKKKGVEEVTQEGFIDPPDIAGLGKEKVCGVCLGPGGGKGSDMFLECRR